MWLVLLFLIEVEAMLGKVEDVAVVCRVREKDIIDDESIGGGRRNMLTILACHNFQHVEWFWSKKMCRS
tara:strand:+ start:7455 stop:7661 length:207 start_codon:yes stop_codon:yes gene_type:complete